DPPSTCTTRTSPRAECARASEPIFPVADRSLSRRADHAVARGRARYAAVTEGRVTSSRSGAPCVRPGRRLRPLARSLVDRMARAGQHHRGRAQLHGRIVHVTGHGLPGTFDTQHAMIQDLLYLKRVRHRRSLSGLMARPVPCRVLVTPVPYPSGGFVSAHAGMPDGAPFLHARMRAHEAARWVQIGTPHPQTPPTAQSLMPPSPF